VNDTQRAVLRYFDDARRLRELVWMRDCSWRRMTRQREQEMRYYAGLVIAWGVH